MRQEEKKILVLNKKQRIKRRFLFYGLIFITLFTISYFENIFADIKSSVMSIGLYTTEYFQKNNFADELYDPICSLILLGLLVLVIKKLINTSSYFKWLKYENLNGNNIPKEYASKR